MGNLALFARQNLSCTVSVYKAKQTMHNRMTYVQECELTM